MVSTFPSLQAQPAGAAASSSSSGAQAAAAGAASVTATTAVAATSAEEEAFKRNTDCVYFLASPLTCKKGSECEYRHSDVARVNPRDCWYWLHGNCLNPKCGFRHPPLDGLLGTQMPNPMGTSLPASQPAPAPAAPVPYASGKQGVACIFFQKGNCLKGDWCPFSHAPNSANSKVVQSQSAIPAIERLTFKKNFTSLEKCTQAKKITQTGVLKPAELNPQAKPIAKVECAPAKKEININKSLLPSGVEHELHGYRPVDIQPANNGNRVTGASCVQQPLQVNNHADTLNVKDPEQVSREPSPGFDVLVDNELGDSDYYHSEDHFGITGDHEGMNEYYDGRPSGDYSPLVDADHDVYRDSRGYDSYERLQDHYALDQHRSSSERMSGVLPHPERRRYGRADSLDQIDESDLRHQLSKHRRVNGLRSVINHDYARERPDGRDHQSSRRDLRHERDRQESSLGNRLRGRIKIPGMSSSPTVGGDLRHSRETERGRERSGSSPRRSQVSSRLQDRIRGRVHEDANNDLRNNRGLRMTTENDDTDFAAPKSLAELKSYKNADGSGSDQQSVGKRKYSKIDYQQQTGDDLSFEGPKPLEEILKRKKGSETAVFGGNMTSHNTEGNNQHERDESSKPMPSQSRNDSNFLNHNENEDKLASGVKVRLDGAQPGDSHSFSHNTNEAELEEGMIVEDGAENQEPEAYDHGDEDSDYEQGGGDNYNLDEGDNGDGEEEYLDDDDGDDFAKKMGVMY